MKKLVLLSLLLIVVAGGAVFFLQYQPVPRSKKPTPIQRELPDWENLVVYQNKQYHFSVEYPAAYQDVRETSDGVSFAVGKTWPWEYAVTATSTNALTTLKWYVTKDRLRSPDSTPKEGQVSFTKLIGVEDHEFFVYDTWRMVDTGDDTSPYLYTYTEVAVVDQGRLFTFSYHYSKKYGEDLNPNLEKLVKSFHFLK